MAVAATLQLQQPLPLSLQFVTALILRVTRFQFLLFGCSHLFYSRSFLTTEALSLKTPLQFSLHVTHAILFPPATLILWERGFGKVGSMQQTSIILLFHTLILGIGLSTSAVFDSAAFSVA